MSTDNLGDEHHSMEEMYQHRAALFFALMQAYPHLSWMSKQHDDGTMFDDCFIAGMKLMTGDITYHSDIKYWDVLKDIVGITVLEKAPKWDGHTPEDVVSRLMTWLIS